jgi:hypothetical protein
VFIAAGAFPLLGAPSRSIFTIAVSNNEYLADHQGSLQALMSMMTSVPGFLAPWLVAAFVLRTPAEVEASKDQREFTPYALLAPLLAMVNLACVLYVQYAYPVCAESGKEVNEGGDEEEEINERHALLGKREGEEEERFPPRTEACRRETVTLMNIPQISFHHDHPTKPSHESDMS